MPARSCRLSPWLPYAPQDKEQLLEANAQLIEANDHVNKPRGRLCYHMALVGLLAACAFGKNAMAEMMAAPMPEPSLARMSWTACARSLCSSSQVSSSTL